MILERVCFIGNCFFVIRYFALNKKNYKTNTMLWRKTLIHPISLSFKLKNHKESIQNIMLKER